MPNTYSQLYVHIVFAVKGRANLISLNWKENLNKYIAGIIANKKQKLIVINGMPDHIHLLVGLNPDSNLSDLVRDIKSNSSKWVNESKFVRGRFEWQTGFGAFSIGQSQLSKVVRYILNQEEHHKRVNFRAEYIAFLQAYQIDFKPEYLPEDIGVSPTELNIGHNE